MKNKGIVFCPSDSVSADNWVTGTSALSYWWKTAADTAWFGGTSRGVTVTKCQKESDFGYTADQVLIYEHSGFHTGDMVLKDGVQINICFMDSHVKTTPLRLCQASAATTYPAPATSRDGGECDRRADVLQPLCRHRHRGRGRLRGDRGALQLAHGLGQVLRPCRPDAGGVPRKGDWFRLQSGPACWARFLVPAPV